MKYVRLSTAQRFTASDRGLVQPWELGDPLRGCLVAVPPLHALDVSCRVGVLVQGNVTADRSVLLQNENGSSGHLALFADKRPRPRRLVGEPEWRANLGGEDRAQVPPGPTQFGVTQIGGVELPGSPSSAEDPGA
jgi:hypothetical protein